VIGVSGSLAVTAVSSQCCYAKV